MAVKDSVATAVGQTGLNNFSIEEFVFHFLDIVTYKIVYNAINIRNYFHQSLERNKT